jgi:hypothetical protein
MKPIHAKAARLLVTGMSPGDVAVAVGVYPTTVSHWRRAPAFVALLEQYQREAFQTLCAVFARRLADGRGVGRRTKRSVSARSLANLRRGTAAPTRSLLTPSPALLPDAAPMQVPATPMSPETLEVLRRLNTASRGAASSPILTGGSHEVVGTS